MNDPRFNARPRPGQPAAAGNARTPFSSAPIGTSRTDPLDLAPFTADAPAEPSRPAPRVDWYEPPALDYDDGSTDATPALRLLPPVGDVEPIWKRLLFILAALAIAGGYFAFLMSYWSPAPGRIGIDENAYLVGGRNFADHFSTGYKPANEFAYVGLMWVQSPKNGWVYPKYSAGLSVLVAIAIKLGGVAHGSQWAFMVNPICTSLALLAMFFLVRGIAGSFWGLMAMFALGFGYTTLVRANNPDSHASALFLVTAGMGLLLRWWQTGSTWRGVLAGLLLGAAVTVRYNEAMLFFPLYPLDHFLGDTAWWKHATHPGDPLHWAYLLVKFVRILPIGPIGIALLLSIRWRRPASYVRAAIPAIAWALPVGALILFNFKTLGTMTGYDLTHESDGFSTHEFLTKWPFAVDQIQRFGLFLILPLAAVGLALMFRRSARTGLFFTLWFLPGSLLFVAYYWGNRIPGVGFLRFYLTFFPAAIAAAMWLIHSAGRGSRADDAKYRGSVAVPIGAGILVAAAAAVGANMSLQDLEIEQRHNLDLVFSAGNVERAMARADKTAARPVAFCDAGLFPHLLCLEQLRRTGDWYTTDAFDMRFNGSFGAVGFQGWGKKKEDADAPVLIQQSRIDAQVRLLKGMTATKLVDEQHKVVDQALDQHRPVYAILTPAQMSDWKRRFVGDDYKAIELDHWTEPCLVPNEEQQGPLSPPPWPDYLHRGRQELFMIQIVRAEKKA